MIPARHLQALKMILSRLQDQPVRWALTGSMGMALQGMPLEPHDIDIQTDEAGAYAIERLLAEFVVQPVHYRETANIRSHFGKLEIGGVEVEIMGSIQKRLDDDTWDESADIETIRRWVETGGMRVPVLSLEYEAESYRRMGRSEKAEMLQAWLKKHSSQ